MTNEEKIEIYARDICESYGINPDTPMTVNDPPTKRWEMYKDQARAAMASCAKIAAMEEAEEPTYLPSSTGIRKIQLE